MPRVRVTVAYDGSEFHGWQFQPKYLTTQKVVEDGLEKILGERVKVYASGRTDEGVHAIGQVFHFDHNSTIPAEKFPLAMRRVLPDTVSFMSAELVDDDFNARYTAKKKTYLYKMYFGNAPIPYERKYKLYVGRSVQVEKMREACECLLGEHNFTAFCSTGSSATTRVRTIFDVNIEEIGNELHFRITGSGFLYNMVRIIVGTLVDIGKERKPVEQMKIALETMDRKKAGQTALACGLYLEKVEY